MLISRGRILEIASEVAPHIIEVGNAYWSAWVALEAGRRLGVPVPAYYHSDNPIALGDKLRRFIPAHVTRALTKAIEAYLVNLNNRMAVTMVATKRFKNLLEAIGVERVVRAPLGSGSNGSEAQTGGVPFLMGIRLSPYHPDLSSSSHPRYHRERIIK
jgi:alpha-1,6-mannosyltransferase